MTTRHMVELEGSGLVVDTALVSRYDLEGNLIDSIARLPHNERIVQRGGDFYTTLGAPFSARGQIVGTASGFCYTFGPVADVRCFDAEGRLERILRVPTPPRDVTEAHILEFWEEQLSQEEGPRLDAFRRMRDFMTFPSVFPAYSQLLVDDAERIWAREYGLPNETDETWFIFELDGLVGELRSPLGFHVMDVRGNRIAGILINYLGVEFVQVYEFESALPN